MEFPALRNLAFFDGLSENELGLFAACFRTQWLGAGTVVFRQGDQAENLYLLVKGSVAIQYKPEDGAEMVVTHVQPGGVFSWSAAMGNLTYTSGAICQQDCQVLKIGGVALRALCEKHPEAGKIILERLAAVIAERQKSREKVARALSGTIQL